MGRIVHTVPNGKTCVIKPTPTARAAIFAERERATHQSATAFGDQ